VESGDTVSTFWFAKDRPGMPVLFTTEQAGALTSTTFVIDDFVHEADDQAQP
jgi:hypothetical protein